MRCTAILLAVFGALAACEAETGETSGAGGDAPAASHPTGGVGASGGGTGTAPGASSVADAAPPAPDCGGATGTKCDAGKACNVHADCASDACRAGVCAHGKSCRQPSGGGTCGAGEPGGANHEDCCVSIEVPRPPDRGGPYRLDKYLVTAGRMRAFLEDVKSDVKSWVAKNPPPGWTDEWTRSVPGNPDEVRMQLGVGQEGATSYGSGRLGPGCYVKGMGAPAYWLSPAEQAANGDVARAFTKDELDSKILNCATRALFAAFCHWDGGRLPTRDEWRFAVDGGDAARTYPWGTELPIGKFASYDFNYSWPRALGEGDVDRGAILPAPGRFVAGKGPFGHMDLAGAVETFTAEGGVMQYSFQEAGREQYGIPYGRARTWAPSTKHWAIGARCARPAN